VGQFIARTAVEPQLRAILAGNDAEAVVLDLVQPLAAGRQLIGFGWEARRRPAVSWLVLNVEISAKIPLRDFCCSAKVPT
jgi:hypothetical protein